MRHPQAGAALKPSHGSGRHNQVSLSTLSLSGRRLRLGLGDRSSACALLPSHTHPTEDLPGLTSSVVLDRSHTWKLGVQSTQAAARHLLHFGKGTHPGKESDIRENGSQDRAMRATLAKATAGPD
jgi:hypothetical protein